ncbi:hypothetical protein [Rhizobium leguminosarum]|uniref:hypothetical protein n=1 Tax=Rhizobium leguminosarum TaxID=384 RepID=UPI000482BF97|nr:hypothetical protein [Rhizobium leguminosarum]
MASCRVVAYLVELRKLNARAADNLHFGSFNGPGSESLRTALQKILVKMSRYQKLAMHSQTYKFVPTWANTGPLTGKLFVGEFGQAADIIETANGKVAYQKKKTEALPHPYYFHLEVPDKETRGILCLQQTGLSGVKTLLETILVGIFEKQYPEYRLHVRSLTMTDTLVHYMKNGVIEEIIVEKHEIPADIADRFGGARKSYPGKFTYSIKPDKSSLFKRGGLIAFSKGQKTLDEVFEFGDLGFDVVKTKVRVGDELKTVNLTRPESINTSYDITDEVAVGADGYPTTASLKAEFTKIVQDLAKRGGIKL